VIFLYPQWKGGGGEIRKSKGPGDAGLILNSRRFYWVERKEDWGDLQETAKGKENCVHGEETSRGIQQSSTTVYAFVELQ